MIKFKNIYKLRYIILVYLWKLIFFVNKKNNLDDDFKIIFLIEKADWAISKIGFYIANNINSAQKKLISLSSNPHHHQYKLLHFGSHYMWLQWYKYLTDKNNYVVSFFHGNPEHSQHEKDIFDDFLVSSHKIHKIIVSNSIVKNRLLKNGIKANKIIQIPIGVDTNHFFPPTKKQRTRSCWSPPPMPLPHSRKRRKSPHLQSHPKPGPPA